MLKLCHNEHFVFHSQLRYCAGNLALVAGDSSGTGAAALGGSVTISAGTASAGGQQSSLQLLGTDSTGSNGNILLSSTGNILLQSPVFATSSSTLGTTATDTMTVNALAAFQAAASVAGAFTAQSNVTLGESSAQSLTVNAQTTFAPSSEPITANAAVLANSNLAVAGNTTLGSTMGGQSMLLVPLHPRLHSLPAQRCQPVAMSCSMEAAVRH